MQPTGVLHGWHVINGWVRGYYIKTSETAVCVKGPNGVPPKVRVHEIAHHKEHMLGLIPPWHYAAWRNLFLQWYNTDHVVQSAAAKFNMLKDEHLPFCRTGDIVEVDFVDGTSGVYLCTRKGLAQTS